MSVKKCCLIGLILAVILSLGLATPAMAVPQIPHAFYGTVTIGGGPAPDGIFISARIGDTEYATTTTLDGKYGYSPTFKVPGDDPDTPDIEGGVKGDTIEFYLQGSKVASCMFANGQVTNLPLETEVLPDFNIAVSPSSVSVRRPGSALVTIEITGVGDFSEVVSLSATGQPTGVTVEFSPESGAVPFNSDMDLNVASTAPKGSHTITIVGSSSVTDHEATLTLTVTTPPPAAGPTYYYIQTNLFGIEARYRIERDGELLRTIEATSADGNLTMTIPDGTVALDKDSNRLETLEATIDETPPDPPEDAYIIELAYDFGPDGAMFSPPINLAWNYDPDVLPEGITEESLIMAYYDEDGGEWIGLVCEVDTENNTITASGSHFTTFAIIGSVTPLPVPAAFTTCCLRISPSEVNIGETVTIRVSVNNTGGESGSYTVVLKINGVKEADERVTIAAGNSKTVSFSVTREEADTYTVAVDGLSDSFTVVAPVVVVPPEPADLSVSSLSVLPAEVEPGETVTIDVAVTNTGGKSGSYTVVLKIDGVKEADETVTIAAGESQEVSFSVTREEAGSYTVAVDGLSGSFTVVAPPVGEEEEEEEVPIKPAFNWPLVGGIIGGVVVVAGLLYYFLVFRRRYY